MQILAVNALAVNRPRSLYSVKKCLLHSKYCLSHPVERLLHALRAFLGLTPALLTKMQALLRPDLALVDFARQRFQDMHGIACAPPDDNTTFCDTPLGISQELSLI